jgi:addiction module HigA family antidote
VSPPGATLLDLLEERGLSQADLAARTGRPRKTINEIVQGKAAITPDTALQFERVFGTPADFWLAREAHYQEFIARQREQMR